MVADFLRDARCTRLPAAITPLTATLVTGVSVSCAEARLARLKGVRGRP
jgi:hypothetical protein